MSAKISMERLVALAEKVEGAKTSVGFWPTVYARDVGDLLFERQHLQGEVVLLKNAARKKLNWSRILRYVPVDEKINVRTTILQHYADVVTTNYPVVKDDGGTLRFRRDPVVHHLVDALAAGGLNALARQFPERKTMPEMRALYRRLGYSLGGFAEVFCSGT